MLFGERLKKQGGRTFRNRESRPLVVRALLVSLFGLAVRVRTAGHTPDRTSDRRTAEGQVADEPNTTGIYSVMRNRRSFQVAGYRAAADFQPVRLRRRVARRRGTPIRLAVGRRRLERYRVRRSEISQVPDCPVRRVFRTGARACRQRP